MGWLEKFVSESNKIEGILRAPSKEEIEAHERILSLERVELPDVEHFVSVIAPRHILRSKPGLDVYVGNHVPPLGGPDVGKAILILLGALNIGNDPYVWHHQYETLHPFTDGNGRSGRVLWLWLMQKTHQLNRAMKLGFLHEWYYQSLQAGQGRY